MPLPTTTDSLINTDRILLSRLHAAWLTLDYMLRFSLIHAHGLSFNTVASERIFAITDVTTIMDKLLAHYTLPIHEDFHSLCHQITAIPDGLYKRYRIASFALWARDPGSGQLIFDRIGQHNWRKPLPQTTAQIETLIRDIHHIADRIETLTKEQ